MNADKFGAFIAACRKEQHMTQLELAQKLQVTDKAVSRWERGKGFPDISMLIPLSEALEITVTELMRSEKMEKREDHFSREEVEIMMADMAEMEGKNRRENRIIAGIANPVVILVALAAVLSGRTSLLVGLMLGCAVALIIIGICMSVMDQKNRDSRRAYGLLMLLGTGGTFLFLYLLGIDSSLLLGALFLLFCVMVGVMSR